MRSVVVGKMKKRVEYEKIEVCDDEEEGRE